MITGIFFQDWNVLGLELGFPKISYQNNNLAIWNSKNRDLSFRNYSFSIDFQPFGAPQRYRKAVKPYRTAAESSCIAVKRYRAEAERYRTAAGVTVTQSSVTVPK